MTDFPYIADHLMIWVFGIILPFLSGLQSDKLNGEIRFDTYSRKKLYLGNSIMLSVAGSSIFILWYWKSRTWTSLGFQWPASNNSIILWAAGILLTIMYAIDLIYAAHAKDEQEEAWFDRSSFLPQSIKELPLYILLCLCAGFFEEIIYRGFMVSYFLEGTKDAIPWLALLAPAILFSLAHFYQGWAAVLKITILAILLNVIFIYSKSLYPTMIIHFLIDLISGIAGMKRKQSQ
jgi:membrane protease YdiL (CAAX protease family)